jgi:hypothetical protein
MSKVPTWQEYVKKSGLSEQQALTVVETVEEMSAEEREAAFTIMVMLLKFCNGFSKWLGRILTEKTQ